MTDKDVPVDEATKPADEESQQTVEDSEEEQGEAPPPAEAQGGRRDGNGGWPPPQYPPPPGYPPSAYPLTYDRDSPDARAYAAYRHAGHYPPGMPPAWPYPYYAAYMGPSGPVMYPHYLAAAPPASPMSPPKHRASDAAGTSGSPPKEVGSTQSQRPPKAYIACHYCRMRKIKCDGARPECGTCSRYGQGQCTYDQDRRKRGPAKKKRGDNVVAEQPSQATVNDEAQIRAQRLIEELRRNPPDALQSMRTVLTRDDQTASDTALTTAAIINALPALAAGLARLPPYQWTAPSIAPATADEECAATVQDTLNPATSASMVSAKPAQAAQTAPSGPPQATTPVKSSKKGKAKEDNAVAKPILRVPASAAVAPAESGENTRTLAKGKRKKGEAVDGSAEQSARKRVRKAAAETGK